MRRKDFFIITSLLLLICLTAIPFVHSLEAILGRIFTI
jgi:hypothetical protein